MRTGNIGPRFQRGFWGAVIGAGISTLGSLIGGKKSRDTAIELANTAVQRRVKDLKAAGLNPMLGYSGSADSPPMPDFVGPSVSRGVETFSAAQAARQIKAQTELLDAQKANVMVQSGKTQVETELLKAQVPFSAFTAEMSAKKLSAEYTKLANEVKSALHGAEIAALNEKQQRDLMPLIQQYQALKNQSESLGIPLKEAEAKFFETVPAAKWIMLIRQVLGK